MTAIALTAATIGVLAHVPQAWTFVAASLAVTVVLTTLRHAACSVRQELIWRAIAENSYRDTIAELARERARLDEPRRRKELARSLLRTLSEAENWYQTYPPSRPLAETRTLAAYPTQIRAIAAQVENTASNTRGAAALAHFLTGTEPSALLSGDAQRVEEQLNHIAHLLTLDSEP